ncbi:hypothetical protein [Halobacillus kuroshimensis]|uniref:hypothetical protein n=1 Tax=Halobacillus kuroshimensis TaxID=302481 RepID=UPI0004234B4F|nr:hypothetical protein [Halobacillus kuroshimensis]
MERFRKKWMQKSAVILTAFTLFTAGASAAIPHQVEAKSWKQDLKAEEWKCNDPVISTVYKDMRKETKKPHSFSEAESSMETMNKADIMDHYLDRNHRRVTPYTLIRVVDAVFSIDLQAISDLGVGKQTSSYSDDVLERVREASPKPLSDEDISQLSKVRVMELYWLSYQKRLTADERYTMINEIFGVNLVGIAGLEGTGVALFSKNQWISQYDTDLFIVETGSDDVDVWVYPTEYFKQQTGLEENPEELNNRLTKLGFSYSEEKGAFYYADPNGESVPDAFKGQTLGTIIGFIQEQYKDLLEIENAA